MSAPAAGTGSVRAALRAGFGGRIAARPALVAVPFDLPGELVRDEVDRVPKVGRGLPGAKRYPLQMECRLGDLAVGDRGVLLLHQFEVEPGQLRYLLGDFREALLDVVLEGCRDCG